MTAKSDPIVASVMESVRSVASVLKSVDQGEFLLGLQAEINSLVTRSGWVDEATATAPPAAPATVSHEALATAIEAAMTGATETATIRNIAEAATRVLLGDPPATVNIDDPFRAAATASAID